MNPQGKIKVLVVDDSALVRRVIRSALAQDPGIEVVGTAGDPYEAREKILALRPDVLTLDIEMPRLDGLSFLRILQQQYPIPVIMVSTLTQSGSRASLEALESGAMDVLAKPASAQECAAFGRQLIHCVKGAAAARCSKRPGADTPPVSVPRSAAAAASDSRQLILIGSSTGGIEALGRVLPALPDGLPGICVVQHLPRGFTTTLAERLNQKCRFEVREAAQGDLLKPGLALIAPGDFHLRLRPSPAGYQVVLDQSPPHHFCRPAVDALFLSAAECRGVSAVAVILTGMGQDGTLGMQKLKECGAHTIAQNEDTCVVFGMPRAAIEAGAVKEVLPLAEIPAAIVRWTARGAGARKEVTA